MIWLTNLFSFIRGMPEPMGKRLVAYTIRINAIIHRYAPDSNDYAEEAEVSKNDFLNIS